jgi:exopolysaccharide biosynthesis protein
LTALPAPAVTVVPPIITASDPALNNAKSYVVTFSMTHYSKLKQLADDATPKTLSTWMATVPGAILGWNSSAFDPFTRKLGDIVVNGSLHDNFGTEDWSFARSQVVIDVYGRLTCRDFASVVQTLNVPPGITDRQFAEYAWQTASFRPPLVVDSTIYDPVATGLIPASGMTQLSGRTSLGQKADGTFVLCVVDGASNISGCTIPQMQAKMLALGCVQAFNLDGGGSTTLWYSGAVINSPSDAGGERLIPAAMYV